MQRQGSAGSTGSAAILGPLDAAIRDFDDDTDDLLGGSDDLTPRSSPNAASGLALAGFPATPAGGAPHGSSAAAEGEQAAAAPHRRKDRRRRECPLRQIPGQTPHGFRDSA